MTDAVQENLAEASPTRVAKVLVQSDASNTTEVEKGIDKNDRLPAPKEFVPHDRFASRLPSLDEHSELTPEDYSTTSTTDFSSSVSENSKKKGKAKKRPSIKGGDKQSDRLKSVKDLQKEATEKAHRGEEEEAQKLYRNAIQIAGSEIARINFRIVKSQEKHEETRISIQKKLREDLRKIGLIIGKLRTKMAILYERSGDFERAISCCREAMEIYKHQPAVEETTKNNAQEMMDLMKIMCERLEQSFKALEGRDAMLMMIKEYRRSIGFATDPKEKKELYGIVEEMAKKVESMEISALGESHPQLAETLQLLSTIALEQGKHHDAVVYLEKAIKISKASLGLRHARIGQYYLRLARIHLSQGIESLALETFHSATDILRHSEKFARVLGSTFNDVAVIYMRRREYDNATVNLHEALLFYERALEEESRERDPLEPKNNCALSTDTVQVLRNLGECYMKQEEFEKARVELMKVLKLQRDARKVYDNVIDLDIGIIGVETFLLTLIDDESIADTLVRLGRAEAAAGDHQKAVAVFKEAIDLFNRVGLSEVLANGPSALADKQQRSRRDQVTNTLYCIAEECSALGEYDEALRFYSESMRLRSFSSSGAQEKQSSILHCALCFVGIANAHLGKNEFVRAKKLLNETQDYCRANAVPTKHPVTAMVKHSLKEVMRSMAQAASQRKEELVVLEERAMAEIADGDFEKALATLNSAMEIRKNTLATLRSAGEDTAEQFHGIACLLRSFGSIYARMGDEENADRAYSDATRLFKRSGAYESIEL